MKYGLLTFLTLLTLISCSQERRYINIFVDGSSRDTIDADGSLYSPFQKPEQAFKLLWRNGNGKGSEQNSSQRVRVYFRAMDESGNPITYNLDPSEAPIHIEGFHDFELVGGWPGETERPVFDGGSRGSGDPQMKYEKMEDAFHRFRFMNCHHFSVSNFVFQNFQFSAILVVHSSHFDISNNLIRPVYNICQNLDGTDTRFAYGTQSIGIYMCNELSVGYKLNTISKQSIMTGHIHDNIVICEPISNAHNWGIYFTGGVSNVAVYRNIVINSGISFKSIHGSDFENAIEAGAFHNILVYENLILNCRTGMSLYDGNPTDSFHNEWVIVKNNWFKSNNSIHWKWEFEDDCYVACPDLRKGTEINHCWSHGSMIKNIGVANLEVKANLFDFSNVDMSYDTKHENGISGPVSELRVFQFTPGMYYSYDTTPDNLAMQNNVYLFRDKHMRSQAVQALYTAQIPKHRVDFDQWKSLYDKSGSITCDRSHYEQNHPDQWNVLQELWKVSQRIK